MNNTNLIGNKGAGDLLLLESGIKLPKNTKAVKITCH